MSDKSVYQINLEFLAKRLEGDADEVVSFFEELFDSTLEPMRSTS